MDMGVATELGSPTFFAAVWVPMMAAMMLPGAAPAVSRYARAEGTLGAPLFAASYLAVWAAVGLAVYALYAPHGTAVAGALTVAAGLYELTPLKRRCLSRCRSAHSAGALRSGLEHGRDCVGCSGALMAVLFVLGVMSLFWMAAVTVVIFAEKVLPRGPRLAPAVAVALVVLGVWVAASPGSVPGLTDPAGSQPMQMQMGS